MQKYKITTSLIFLILMASCDLRPVPLADVDKSHSLEQALKTGAPSIEESWGPAEYKAFDLYLANIAQEAYPRMNSAKSEKLFAKVLSKVESGSFEGLDIANKKEVLLTVELQLALNDSCQKYWEALVAGYDYTTEFVHLQGALITIGREMCELTNAFIPTINPNDGKYEVRMKGVKKYNEGSGMVLTGYLSFIEDTRMFSLEERKILCSYLLRNGECLYHRVKKTKQHDLKKKIIKLTNTEHDNTVKSMLSKFLTMISTRSNIAGEPDGKKPGRVLLKSLQAL